MSSTYRPIQPILTQAGGYVQATTSLCFDPVSDTLWTGNERGSVVAYYGTHGARGVVFPVGGGYAVNKIQVGEQVRALGGAGVGVGSWSKGGVNRWFYKCVSVTVIVLPLSRCWSHKDQNICTKLRAFRRRRRTLPSPRLRQSLFS